MSKEGKITESVLTLEQMEWMYDKIDEVYAETDMSDDYYDGFCDAIAWLTYIVPAQPKLKKYIKKEVAELNEYKQYREKRNMFGNPIDELDKLYTILKIRKA